MTRIYNTDANHAEIKADLEDCGIRVFDTAMVGGGFPDLVTGGIHRETYLPQIVLFEVKTEDGRLRPGQQAFLDEWHGLPVYVVKSSAEALEKYGIVDYTSDRSAEEQEAS